MRWFDTDATERRALKGVAGWCVGCWMGLKGEGESISIVGEGRSWGLFLDLAVTSSARL